jgi:nitroreductase
MNFLELVRRRQSVRSYLEKSVEREKIDKCLEAARLAPSALNAQPWRFIVIDDPILKNKIAEKTFSKIISFNRFSLQAPVLIVIISNYSGILNKIKKTIKNRQFYSIDIGIAVENICLQATEEGLGTCILGWFDQRGIKDLLDIPEEKKVELVLTMGYPVSTKIRLKKRKNLDEIRSYNKL